MRYIRACFDRLALPRLGAILAAAFAALCVLNAVSMGSVIPVNAVASALEGVFRVPPLWTGTILAVLTFLVIRRGRGGVLAWTERLVPLMTLGYIVLSAAVLLLRADRVGDAFAAILNDAFSPAAAAGGVGGFLLSRGVRYGVMRGLVSNEAGCGTAPAAHAVSDCSSPARQGVFGIAEVFVDTILLCTVTALVVIVSYGETVAREGDFMMMTIRAYSVVLGDFAACFMSVAVLCFGFATVLCWSHYGAEAVSYVFPKPIATRVFMLVYSLSVCVGAVAAADWIWELTDFAVGWMTLINVAVLLLSCREVREETILWLAEDRRRKRP
jgi:AGCS family alanine or glycine:cation symporter